MSTSPFPCTQSIKRIERSEMQVVLLHSFQNVLKAVLGHRKARRVTSTSSGLKRLKTQNTMSEKRKGDTLKGIPKSIHKRELILDEEEFDASSFGGDGESRTRVRKHFRETFSERSQCFFTSLQPASIDRHKPKLSRCSPVLPGTRTEFSCIFDAGLQGLQVNLSRHAQLMTD